MDGGGGGACEAGRERGRGRRGVGVGCVSVGGGVCGEGEAGGGRSEREVRKHKQFFLAWLVTFTELEKVLKCCLTFRHCRDCFNVLQNHTFRHYFLPVCLLVGCRVPWN